MVAKLQYSSTVYTGRERLSILRGADPPYVTRGLFHNLWLFYTTISYKSVLSVVAVREHSPLTGVASNG